MSKRIIAGRGALEYWCWPDVTQIVSSISSLVEHPGSNNDAWAITESEGGKILMGDSLPIGARSSVALPPQYYGVGDDAFVTCETLLTPYGGTQLNMYKYNFFCARQFLGFISVFQFHTLQVPRLLQLSSLGYAPVLLTSNRLLLKGQQNQRAIRPKIKEEK